MARGRLVPGLRLDYSSNSTTWDFAPRFIARQDLTTGFPRTTLKGGLGIFSQPPQPQETDPVFGQPGLKSNRATQYDVGVEQEITRHVEVSLEGYYKLLDNLVSAGYYNEGHGRAYGLETLLRWKPDGRFFGWLAYTLSRSQRTQPPADVETLYQYDQTHILTVLGSYKLGRGWEFGARFRLVSGPSTRRRPTASTTRTRAAARAAELPGVQHPPPALSRSSTSASTRPGSSSSGGSAPTSTCRTSTTAATRRGSATTTTSPKRAP